MSLVRHTLLQRERAAAARAAAVSQTPAQRAALARGDRLDPPFPYRAIPFPIDFLTA